MCQIIPFIKAMCHIQLKQLTGCGITAGFIVLLLT